MSAALMGVSSSAWAFWTGTGSGTGGATTGTLVAPSGVSATSSAGSSAAVVSWTAPTGAVAPAGYRVDRVDTATGTAAAACGTSATSLLTSTTCTDASVPDGTYRYVVSSVRSGWTAASAPSATVTVRASIATATSLTSSANPAFVGQSVTYTASVTAASGTPTGTVAFSSGGAVLTCSGGSQTLSAGTATCVVTWSFAGTRSVTAAYAGSAPFTASSSTAVAQSVVQRSQTITFTSTAPGAATVGGPTYTPTATATSGLPVTFVSTTTAVCTVSGSTFSFVAPGACTIAADQPGDTTYGSAARVTQTFTVSQAAQTITFTSTAPPSAMLGDAPYAVAASATSGLVVTFTSATPAVCTVSGTSVSYVAAGTCTISAGQAGNATWAAAPQATQSFLVTAAPTPPAALAAQPASGGAGFWTATWTADPGFAYQCQITKHNSAPSDSGWVACTPPYTFTPPKKGNQTLHVRASRGSLVSAPASVDFHP
ncbi:Ig-like domain repeat protein [Terrabacter sp. BE26]|uniref:Ig-like domain repeat protein n=1 Tax=Terrabacter sp. BE26 TaxID=2898152 RepID=UPI0035BE6029